MNSIFLFFFNGALSTGGVLLKKCFPVDSARINRKTPASESLIFNKLQARTLALYEKRDHGTGVYLVIL